MDSTPYSDMRRASSELQARKQEPNPPEVVDVVSMKLTIHRVRLQLDLTGGDSSTSSPPGNRPRRQFPVQLR